VNETIYASARANTNTNTNTAATAAATATELIRYVCYWIELGQMALAG